MAPELLRFFVRFFIGSLVLYAGSWILALGSLLLTSEVLSGLGIAVGYLALYSFFVSGGLLLLYGATSLLVTLGAKLSGAPAASPQATESACCALIGKCLTQYHQKHSPAKQYPSLVVSLVGFEKALQGKLPARAHEDDSWWLMPSEHAQQWLTQGWQVTAVALTGQEPTVTFTRVLSSIYE